MTSDKRQDAQIAMALARGQAGATAFVPFGAPFTRPPALADWTLFNPGPHGTQSVGLTAADVAAGIELVADYSATSIEGILRPLPAPSALSRVRACFYYASPVGPGAAGPALFLRNSGSLACVSFDALPAFEAEVQSWTDQNTPSGAATGITGTFSNFPTWYELVNVHGGNLTLRVSTDGKRFVEVFSAATDPGVDGWGFCLIPSIPVPTPPAAADIVAATLLSWQEFTS